MHNFTINKAGLTPLFLLGLGLLFSSSSFAQRFFTRVFDEVDVTTDITYGNANNYLDESENLLLDFYEPQGDEMAYRPLIIYVHGGGFIDVAQTKSLVHIVAYADSMSSRGYTVASINYRLDTSISNRAIINAMHDAKAAVRFFRANFETYKIDTSKIFIGGESAGAITSLTTTYIDKPGEVVYPPTLPLCDDLTVEGNSGNPGYSSATKAALCLCGGIETISGEPLFDTLAIETVADPPLLIVHGTEDTHIPTIYALYLALRANTLGVPYLFYTMPGATHCPWFYPLEDSWEYLDTLINYSVPFLYACVVEGSGIEEIDIVQGLTLFPNPTADVVTVSFDSDLPLQIEIFDLGGRLIYSAKIVSNEQIDFSSWDSGIYLIRTPDEGWSQKLIKK